MSTESHDLVSELYAIGNGYVLFSHLKNLDRSERNSGRLFVEEPNAGPLAAVGNCRNRNLK
jgi:hypothetical protein